MSNYQLVPWKQLLSSQVKGKIIPPSTTTFDYLRATDGKIVNGILKLLSLFVTSEAITSEEIKANVINHMKIQPEEYTSTMTELWKNMVLRVNTWKYMNKDSAKAIAYCDSFIMSFTQKAIEHKHLDNNDMIIHYISICKNKFEEIKLRNQPDNMHENVEFMAKCYEFEASVYILLCMMIINPNYISTYYNDVRYILENYFKHGITIQQEGGGICAALSVRYVRGMLRCNLTEDEGYRCAFHENIPKGLENELHEEINDHVDLLYAYAVLMKYKLFNDLDIRIPLYHILDCIKFDSSNETVGIVKLPYISSNPLFREEHDEISSDTEISLLRRKLKSANKSYNDRKKDIRKETKEYVNNTENEMYELIRQNKEKINVLDELRNAGKDDDEVKTLEDEININKQTIQTLEQKIDEIIIEQGVKLQNADKEWKKEEKDIKHKINLFMNEQRLSKFKEDLKSAEEMELSRDYEHELIHLITIHRESINKEYKYNAGYRCLSSVIFRRYRINNRIRILDSNNEFLLYLSYFQSILALNDRNKLSNRTLEYSFFVEIGHCLNPLMFNLEDSDDIINELVDVICKTYVHDTVGTVPNFRDMKISSSTFNTCRDVARGFHEEKIDEELYNIMYERIMGKQGFSMDDICKYYLLHSEGDSIEQYINIIRTINNHEKYGIEDYNEAYMFKLHHETIKRINEADTSKSSIPIWCRIDSIITTYDERPYYKFNRNFHHAYAKELFNDAITIYDPNLLFAVCSDMSISDVILPYVDKTIDLYPYYTERIQFYGGNEHNDDKMITTLFRFMLIITMIVIIMIIVVYIRQRMNETVNNTTIQTTIRELKL